MKRISLILFYILTAQSLVACSTPAPRQGYQLPPALREVFRGGQIKGLEDHTNPNGELGPINPYDLTSHTCTSSPIFNLDGSYHRTAVRCY